MFSSHEMGKRKYEEDHLAAHEKYHQLLCDNEGKLEAQQKQFRRTERRSVILRNLMRVHCGKAGHEFGDWYRPAFDEDGRRTCKICGMDTDDEHSLVAWFACYQSHQEKKQHI
jgi:hypothetical protein